MDMESFGFTEILAVAESVLGLAALLVALLGGVTILQRRSDGAGRLMGASALTLFVGFALYFVPRALAGLAGMESGFWLSAGRMAAALAVTVFCILLSLLWEKLYAQKNGFFAEAHVRELSGARALTCLFPVFVRLSARMQGEKTDPMADVTGLEALILPAVRGVTLLAVAAIVAWHWRKTRSALPTLRHVWLLLSLAALFEIAADFGAAYAPATALLCIPELVCLLWIVTMFVRFAGETGERH